MWTKIAAKWYISTAVRDINLGGVVEDRLSILCFFLEVTQIAPIRTDTSRVH